AGKNFAIAAFSGSAGGIVDAELKSGFRASSRELLSSALGYAVFGTAMEAGGLCTRRIFDIPLRSRLEACAPRIGLEDCSPRSETSLSGQKNNTSEASIASSSPGARASRPLRLQEISDKNSQESTQAHVPPSI